ncbi:MAG: hypothetical protein SLAVMIC_00221 [uncultured marine phage]|uniref:Uncharacterized protein n=1 Tax=uncultured marine phage TaxID=707152 RepID=A0A8D9FQK5_9VIRU|nr:MAG: hypothetical protein SLAVMIC_00221 [uncultured marine phage]
MVVAVIEHRLSARYNGYIFYKVRDVIPFKESSLKRFVGRNSCWVNPDTMDIYSGGIGQPLYEKLKVLNKEIKVSEIEAWFDTVPQKHELLDEIKTIIREKRLGKLLD